MPDIIPRLTDRQARKLIAEINAGVEDLGSKLIRLCRGMGWAALGYTSFRECCKAEFSQTSWALGKSPSWVCRQIQSVETKAALPIGNEDLPESVTRELRKLPEADRAEAWQDITSRLGDHPTAEQVAHEVDLLTPCDTPPDEQDDSAAASEDEGEAEDRGEEEDSGEERTANEDGEGDALLNALCDFHDRQWPEMGWPTFAARVENAAVLIRDLA